jgi:hypothetical protein
VRFVCVYICICVCVYIYIHIHINIHLMGYGQLVIRDGGKVSEA